MSLKLLKSRFKKITARTFKTSDYDLNQEQRWKKYKNYDHILCEKCNEEIDKQSFYCEGCYNKETNNYERYCMIYGRSKVGIFKTSDYYYLDFIEREEKYKEFYYILCEKCNEGIDKQFFYCKDCYYKETNNYERYCMIYRRVVIFKISDYDLN